jgi:hypothetical protein
MIKTFRSTGIGNEEPFDEKTAKEWRRKKEATRRFLEELRNSAENPSWSFQERPHGSEDDAGTPDL